MLQHSSPLCEETRNPQPISAQAFSFFHSLIRPKPEKTPDEFSKLDYKQSTSEWGICMRNVTARHRHRREKRIIARYSLSGARLIGTKLLRPHLPSLRAIYPHAPGDIRSHHLKKNLNAKWVQTTLIDLFHPTSPTSPSYHDSRQPRLSSGSRRGSSALSVIIRQSSAVRTHIAVARAVECLRVGDQKRDLPVVIRVFAQDCVQMHVQMIPSGSRRVVNDSHPPTLLFP